MLLLIMVTLQAMPVNTDSTNRDKKSESVKVSNPSAPAAALPLYQLQEENTLLKARLATLENKLEEEKSMLQYQLTMLGLVTKLEQTKNTEKMDDLQSQISFNQVLANTLLLLKNGVSQ